MNDKLKMIKRIWYRKHRIRILKKQKEKYNAMKKQAIMKKEIRPITISFT